MNNESIIIENLSKINKLISSYSSSKNQSENDKINNKSEIKILISQTEKLLKEINNNSSKYKEYKNKIQSLKNEYHLLSNNINDNSYNKIQIATKNTIDMENMTDDIITDLNTQTEKMLGVKTKLNIMDDDLNNSNNLLGNILGKQNDDMKIIIITGIIMIFLILLFLLYKIIKKFV